MFQKPFSTIKLTIIVIYFLKNMLSRTVFMFIVKFMPWETHQGWERQVRRTPVMPGAGAGSREKQAISK